MQYRNNPFKPRKYTYSNNNLQPSQPFSNADISTESIKISTDIPLPNNRENAPGVAERKNVMNLPSILNLLIKKITIEEIILIGVIIILLIEGIEDEFLLLMLAYILIF